MGRAKRRKASKGQSESLLQSLITHGLPIKFAKQVVDTAIDKGWSEARVLLHAGGWEVIVSFVMAEQRISLKRIMSVK